MSIDITLASLFTTAGVVSASAIVIAALRLIGNVFPALDDYASPYLQAFVLTAALYIYAFAATGPFTAEAGFTAFLAFLAAASAAVGGDATIYHVQAVRAAHRRG